ncbi:hypothetical protein BRC86_00370 [Halobacteriales archaeon QS_3_64_16]|nr:MAG: hypothetical protein BRC86_00370 [Halobacteriales archaeon QS_3_64_16]
MAGQIVTGALNASGLTHCLEVSGDSSARNQVLGHVFGIVPPYLFMMLIGILFGVSTGNPDPIEAVIEVAPNPILGSLILLFVILAQISTNLTINILPPTNAFQDSLGISWGQGVLLTGVLSMATLPWLLSTNDLFYTFISFYAAFLGPIIGILLADYWVIRKRDTDVPELYEKSDDSKFWFIRDFSMTRVVSMLVGTALSLPFLNVGWMIGLPVGFASYLLLTRATPDRRVTTYLSADREPTSASEADQHRSYIGNRSTESYRRDGEPAGRGTQSGNLPLQGRQ